MPIFRTREHILKRHYTIEELSKQYLMNTTTLKSVFKAVYGMPIASYMKEYRMKLASNMLLQEDKSISEIAAAVGYKSQSKFTSAFHYLLSCQFHLLHRSDSLQNPASSAKNLKHPPHYDRIWKASKPVRTAPHLFHSQKGKNKLLKIKILQ